MCPNYVNNHFIKFPIDITHFNYFLTRKYIFDEMIFGNMNVEIESMLSDSWHKYDWGFFKGNLFYKSRFFGRDDVGQIFEQVSTVDELVKMLNDVDGFFGLIVEFPHRTVIAGDRYGTIPLFYAVEDQSVAISNSLNQLLDLCDSSVIVFALAEYFIFGYPLNNYTIYEDIYQTMAGELVVFGSCDSTLERVPYFRPENANGEYHFTAHEYSELIDNEIQKSFERVKKISRNKDLIVPISGGFDSRLILSKLEELQIENVKTFTYVNKFKSKMRLGQSVAEELGYEWKGVELTHDMWSDFVRAESFHRITDVMSFGSGFQNLSLLLAAKELDDHGYFNKHAVFLIGHTASDYVKAPVPNARKIDLANPDEFAKHILKTKVSVPGWHLHDEKLQSAIMNSILQYWDGDFESSLYRFKYKERKAKTVHKSGLGINYLGYDFWYPLNDLFSTNLWFNAPHSWRTGKNAYIQYCTSKYGELTGNYVPGNYEKDNYMRNLANFIKNRVKKSPVEDKIQSYYRRIKKLVNSARINGIYGSDPRLGIVNKTDFKKVYAEIDDYRSNYKIFHMQLYLLNNYYKDLTDQFNPDVPEDGKITASWLKSFIDNVCE